MTEIKLRLPDGAVTIGPGTVPTSLGSISSTSIKQISSDLREVSKLGLFPQVAE